MRFILHCRGPLRSNGDSLHKAQIRAAFSRQLRALWAQSPLDMLASSIKPPSSGGYGFLRTVADAQFVPLVTAETTATVELGIVLLRPGPAGAILAHGGDIDNRLKTLFDALSMPQANQVAMPDRQPTGPTYCLLEDDRLVTRVDVRAEQLLEPDLHPSEVDLTVAVRTRISVATYGNHAFG